MQIGFKIIKTLFFTFILLDMFRAPLCPSSGASYCCTCSLWSPCGIGSVVSSSLALDAANDIHKEMLPFSKGYPQRNAAYMGSVSLWISFAASIFFAHKKRTTPRYSIVVHVFRGTAIL
jgi:hypothetical protein